MSTPRKVHLDPRAGGRVEVVLDHALPPLPSVPDTRYVRHVRLRSELLSRFWGRDMELGAIVLLPEGWAEHPGARYPLVINHGHFSRELSGWREAPPDPALPAVDRAGLARECPNGHGPACARYGAEWLVQEGGWRFFQQWTGPGFPRVLLVELQHANPYYDDSYAVNSANVGPYGDALVHELFYPDAFNGAIANCPDPIDFRAYQAVDLYADRNAYFSEGTFRRTPRPSSRDALGRTVSTMEQDNRLELVLGERSRSGEQFDIWEAVFSPVGEDGYPRRIYDKRTGVIDPAVAAHWREHYDLTHLLARDGHCWSGDPEHPNVESRLTYHARFIPWLAERFVRTAPKGADTTSWRY